MNSDLTIRPKEWKLFITHLGDAPVVKSYVAFKATSFLTRLTAGGRIFYHRHWQDGKNLYNVGLSFDREIVRSACGLFDQSVPWGEDGDLSSRIRKTGVPIRYLNLVIADHEPTSIQSDLSMALKIGRGEWSIDRRDNIDPLNRIACKIIELVCDRRRFLSTAAQRVGLVTTGYLIIWKITALMGYIQAWYRGDQRVR